MGPPTPRLIGVVMVPGAVQRIVDVIGEQVDRPVLVEDPGLRVLAYSEHDAEVDVVRRHSIRQRRTTEDVVAWCRAAGVHASRAPVRVKPNRELGFHRRVCVPVYSHDLLLGFVWFIDDNQSLTDDDLVGIDDDIESLSAAMYEERRLPADRMSLAASAAALLDGRGSADEASARLLASGALESDGPTMVLVARVGDLRPGEATSVILGRAVDACRSRIGTKSALTLVRGDHAAVLLRARTDSYEVADRLHASLTERLDGAMPLVTIGGAKARLAEAPRAYDEALGAARMGALVPSLGPVVAWDSLGSYRVLSRLDLDSVDVRTVHPGLARLVEGPDANPGLVETLEAYLESAGNAAATSAALHLHRTTLYYRLQRIEALADTDLKDGDERLCLQLALKVARLRRDRVAAPASG